MMVAKEIPMTKFFPFAAIAGVLWLALSPAAPVGATPLSVSANAAQSTGSPAELVRWRWHRRSAGRASGVGVFIIPGLYWGPAWWDANYARACWKQIQPCKNCARNWAYTC
jgi:hypothetical protein